MNLRKIAVGTAAAGIVAFSGYIFSERSLKNLHETHRDLQSLSTCALEKTKVDFVVIDGGRTEQEHLRNVANGTSWTRRSRHQDGMAIDFAAYVDGKITYDPLPYYDIAQAFYYCSFKMEIPIVWGGEWKAKDLMHIELDREYYP